jgi:hypothetical protein
MCALRSQGNTMVTRKFRLFSLWCACGGVRGVYDEQLRRVECADCHRVTLDNDGAILTAIEIGARLKNVGVRRETRSVLRKGTPVFSAGFCYRSAKDAFREVWKSLVSVFATGR